jgi:uncharacterized protein YjbI with pentapeptide repeats
MSKQQIYQTDVIPDITPDEIVSRWKPELTSLIKNAIALDDELPRIFPPVRVSFLGREISLEDLRGINLSGTSIGAYDLAFCALDYAVLDGCIFRKASLQYSRFFKASLKRSSLVGVQASSFTDRWSSS